jgi:hypothetical protein
MVLSSLKRVFFLHPFCFRVIPASRYYDLGLGSHTTRPLGISLVFERFNEANMCSRTTHLSESLSLHDVAFPAFFYGVSSFRSPTVFVSIGLNEVSKVACGKTKYDVLGH